MTRLAGWVQGSGPGSLSAACGSDLVDGGCQRPPIGPQLERWSRAGRLYGLTVIQLATSAAVALGCQVLLDDWQGFTPPMSGAAAAGIIFLGAAATGGAFVALSWAQTRLDTTTTAVILTFEPLVGAGLGAALGDAWTATTLAGAITVITAVCLVARPSGQTARSRSGCH